MDWQYKVTLDMIPICYKELTWTEVISVNYDEVQRKISDTRPIV